MRKIFFLLAFFFCANCSHAQKPNYDSLKIFLTQANEDSIKMFYLNQLFTVTVYSQPDSSFTYVQQQLLLVGHMNSPGMLTRVYTNFALYYEIKGNYPQALYFCQVALKAAEKSGDVLAITDAYYSVSVIYMDLGDYDRSLKYDLMAKSIFDLRFPGNITNDESIKPLRIGKLRLLKGLANAYEKLNELDSALYYINQANDFYFRYEQEINWAPFAYSFGNIYRKKAEYERAIQYYHQCINQSSKSGFTKDFMDAYNGLAITFNQINKTDSSIFYANKVLEEGISGRYLVAQIDALTLLAGIYKKKNNIDSVAKYLDLTLAVKDSLFSQQKVMQLQALTFNEEVRQSNIVEAKKEYKNQVRTYMLTAGLIVLILLAGILFRNNQIKQKTNLILNKQRNDLEKAIDQLRSAQAQLIQSEKMASLGELTAGVAHEIQNPLNFVNNFSEVSIELMKEMKQELETGKTKEAINISGDIITNLEKIVHHGKRADSIVKGMLQHSRISAGQKEMADINALAAEYLRLSYHGFRAKDKSFNATIKTDLDESSGKINIIPQDVGRALLNLCNNAFYSVSEKKTKLGTDYEPVVTVTTKKMDDKIEIRVWDNGTGIPQKALEKIFQPFFTTKPTGQGTGLGLSLTYDIITKEHGGTIKVETKEGEDAEFIIQLPVNP
jgi:two-component system NtrC family sensor kinase